MRRGLIVNRTPGVDPPDLQPASAFRVRREVEAFIVADSATAAVALAQRLPAEAWAEVEVRAYRTYDLETVEKARVNTEAVS